MLKYCKLKYIFGSSILLLLLKSLIIQKPEINFLIDFPDIKPHRCLKTSPFIGGDMILDLCTCPFIDDFTKCY